MSGPDFRELARQCRALLRTASDLDLAEQLQQWAVECDRRADRIIKGSPKDDLLEQARRHRMRAEEYRVVGEQRQNRVARESFQHLAATYEALARRLEEIADRRARNEKSNRLKVALEEARASSRRRFKPQRRVAERSYNGADAQERPRRRDPRPHPPPHLRSGRR